MTDTSELIHIINLERLLEMTLSFSEHFNTEGFGGEALEVIQGAMNTGEQILERKCKPLLKSPNPL